MKTNHAFLLLRTGALALAVLVFSACRSTTLERSWKAPAAGSLTFNKIMVITATPDGALRRTAEDAMKTQVSSVPVIGSYELAPDYTTLRDRSKMAAVIEEAGVDGIVVLRLISDERDVHYVPGSPMPSPYTSFWGYYTRPFAMSGLYWETGTVVHDRLVGIETNIYSADSESLVWSGYTKTRNPRDVATLVAEIAEVVRAKMREQKLIQ